MNLLRLYVTQKSLQLPVFLRLRVMQKTLQLLLFCSSFSLKEIWTD